jgi:hypothetical protein
VAHNPVTLEAYNLEHNGDALFEHVVSDLRGQNQSIDLAQIQEISDEAVSIKSELLILISQSTGVGIDRFIT